MPTKRFYRWALVLFVPILAFGQSNWTHYGQDPGGTKFSALTEINREHVAQLQEAWTFGTPNLGGSMATGGGLVFIADTVDSRFRAFDSETGEELWSATLPVPGHSTPSRYIGADGKQYVAVIAGGGDYPGQEQFGDYVIAFALP